MSLCRDFNATVSHGKVKYFPSYFCYKEKNTLHSSSTVTVKTHIQLERQIYILKCFLCYIFFHFSSHIDHRRLYVVYGHTLAPY